MAAENNNKVNETAPFTDIETALKAKIEAVKNIADPVEQLLKYKDLKKASDGTYDINKADMVSKEKSINDGTKQGAAIGLGTTILMPGWMATNLLMAVIGTATAASFFLIWPAVVVAGALVGRTLGKKLAARHFDKTHSAEQQHATRMLVMTRRINKAIESLESSLSKNMAALARSPRFEEVKKASPSITAEFNRQAEEAKRQADIAARQKAFLEQSVKTPSNRRVPKPAATA